MKQCKIKWMIILIGVLLVLDGCGKRQTVAEQTAVGGHIDIERLTELNPEIFAWVYVPGTDIDLPVLQSSESDTYYEDHNWKKKKSKEGSLYTEMANLMNMCDFNTIIHGQANKRNTMLSGLHSFEEQSFFDNNGQVYLYLQDNVLTYEIISCYTEEKHSILRDYNLVDYNGCEQYIADMQEQAYANGIYREGWEDIMPYHFLLSFVTDCPEDDDKQYVVVAVLVKDAAGQINRTIYEY